MRTLRHTITRIVIIWRVNWEEQTIEALREAGYRIGAARQAVVSVLARGDCCRDRSGDRRRSYAPTAARSASRASTASLDLLAEQKLVQKIDLGDGRAHYERVERRRRSPSPPRLQRVRPRRAVRRRRARGARSGASSGTPASPSRATTCCCAARATTAATSGLSARPAPATATRATSAGAPARSRSPRRPSGRAAAARTRRPFPCVRCRRRSGRRRRCRARPRRRRCAPLPTRARPPRRDRPAARRRRDPSSVTSRTVERRRVVVARMQSDDEAEAAVVERLPVQCPARGYGMPAEQRGRLGEDERASLTAAGTGRSCAAARTPPTSSTICRRSVSGIARTSPRQRLPATYAFTSPRKVSMRRLDSGIRQTAKKSPTVSPRRPISITPVGVSVRSE